MAVLPIAKIGEPILRNQTQTVSPQELASSHTQQFIDDLIETMRLANGAGLAANQVFQPLRICAIEVAKNPRYPTAPDIPITILVNPQITPMQDAFAGETFPNYEGCLSVPNLRGVVHRIASIRIQALSRNGESLDFNARGFTAGVYQHEVDHLDGKLFVDRVEDPTTLCTWETFTQHQQAQATANITATVEKYGS